MLRGGRTHRVDRDQRQAVRGGGVAREMGNFLAKFEAQRVLGLTCYLYHTALTQGARIHMHLIFQQWLLRVICESLRIFKYVIIYVRWAINIIWIFRSGQGSGNLALKG